MRAFVLVSFLILFSIGSVFAVSVAENTERIQQAYEKDESAMKYIDNITHRTLFNSHQDTIDMLGALKDNKGNLVVWEEPTDANIKIKKDARNAKGIYIQSYVQKLRMEVEKRKVSK